jgi:hypothetical protein
MKAMKGTEGWNITMMNNEKVGEMRRRIRKVRYEYDHKEEQETEKIII